MKNNSFFLLSILIVVALVTQGFGCGSPDLEGAKVYIRNQKDYQSALPLLEKETQKSPENNEAWYLLGMTKGMLGDYEGMNVAFKQSLKISNTYLENIQKERYGHWTNHYNAAIPYMKSDSTQNYDKAVNEYEKALAAWPDTSVTYDLLARAYSAKGDIDNGIKYFKIYWDLSHDNDVYKLAGRLLLQRGYQKIDQFKSDSMNAKQLQIQKTLSETDKGSYKSDVIRALGNPDSQKKDKKNSKREDWIYNQYKMTLTIEGDHVVSKKVAKSYSLTIDSTKYKEAMNDFNGAVDVFEAIKESDPKDNENLSLLSESYVQANRIKEATKTFKLAVASDPGNKTNHFVLGVLYRSVKEYDSAVSEFKEAMKIDTNFVDAAYETGATYYNWGVEMKKVAKEKGDESNLYKLKFRDALPWMEKVVDLKTKSAQEASRTGQDWHAQVRLEDAQIWNTLGTIYALIGEVDKASKQLDEADKIRNAAR